MQSEENGSRRETMMATSKRCQIAPLALEVDVSAEWPLFVRWIMIVSVTAIHVSECFEVQKPLKSPKSMILTSFLMLMTPAEAWLTGWPDGKRNTMMLYMFFELSMFPILVMILGFGSQIEKIGSSNDGEFFEDLKDDEEKLSHPITSTAGAV
uniref:Transmembrane protein n=1 Tax=Angiostrongylus cantonensis TaxID=6313 RepID=A0A158P8D8_ANGCA